MKADRYVVSTQVAGEERPRTSEFPTKRHAMTFARQQLRAPVDVEVVTVAAVSVQTLAVLAPQNGRVP